ncbi:potassium-transporting ATPase subunit F [bacterium]|nr:potassium-transporting ATPase subunit F [bacterium]
METLALILSIALVVYLFTALLLPEIF